MADPIVIKYGIGSSTTTSTGEQETILLVECQQAKKPLANEEIELFVEGKSVEKKKTDKAGKIDFVVKTAGVTSVKGELRTASGGQEKWSLNIPAPSSAGSAAATGSAATAATTPPQPQKNSPSERDPEELQVLRSELPQKGSYRLIARVLNHKGKGLKTKVGFAFQGSHIEVPTNSQGVCTFPESGKVIKLRPGQECRVQTFVSGIKQLSTLSICHHRYMTPREKQRAAANNRRARILLLTSAIMFFVWLAMGIIGLARTDFSQPMFGTERIVRPTNDLSAQERLLLSIPGAHLDSDIKVEISDTQPSTSSGWPKFFSLSLVVILLFSLVSAIYGVFSLREELGEAWRKALEAMIDKHYVHSSDPIFDKWAARAGILSRAIARPSVSGTRVTAEPPVRIRFWDSFKSDFASDFIVELLPRILRAITGRPI